MSEAIDQKPRAKHLAIIEYCWIPAKSRDWSHCKGYVIHPRKLLLGVMIVFKNGRESEKMFGMREANLFCLENLTLLQHLSLSPSLISKTSSSSSRNWLVTRSERKFKKSARGKKKKIAIGIVVLKKKQRFFSFPSLRNIKKEKAAFLIS